MTPINIAAEFSRHPGPRYKSQGPNSGEKFRQELLEPRFLAARQRGELLTIELDGIEFTYPTSFLEEAFGGLARAHGVDQVMSTLDLRSVRQPLLVAEIHHLIRQSNVVVSRHTPA